MVRLRKVFEDYDEIRLAISGLKRTKQKMSEDSYDPGKYGTAYFYCQYIDGNNIGHSDKPQFKEACSACGENVSVLMSYTQTYDSRFL